MKIYDCFTDGSFNLETQKASWAFIIIDGDKIIHQNKGIIENPDWNTGRQIAGECFAVVNALEWAAQNNAKLNVNYDYTGVYFWVCDIWGQNRWKANREYTAKYRKKVLDLSRNLEKMTKVKAHAGVAFNEYVDKLAKT